MCVRRSSCAMRAKRLKPVQAIKDKDRKRSLNARSRSARREAEIETPPASVTRMNAEDSGLPNSAIGGIFSGKPGEVFTYPNRTGDKYMIVQLESVNDPSAADLAPQTRTLRAS
jgi:peptidyl-prolyl cis-trans isomerase D